MLPAGSESAPEVFARLLPEASAAWGMALPPGSIEALSRYLARLDRERRRTNLTGPFPAAELVTHALESALGAPHIPRGARVADVGSGAGFPGIPLAIVRPDVTVVPVELRRKRREFLDGCASEVGLRNWEAAAPALPALAPRSVQAIVVRAVGGLGKTLAAAPALSSGGILLVWTTDPDAVAKGLAHLFVLEASEAVPHTERKRIARFRRRA